MTTIHRLSLKILIPGLLALVVGLAWPLSFSLVDYPFRASPLSFSRASANGATSLYVPNLYNNYELGSLPPGWVRIVLTWQRDGDLDAHLWLYQGGTHVYYKSPGNCSNLEIDLACLPADDIHYGPEVMLLKDAVVGTHAFAVVRNDIYGGMDITAYGAVVKVYDATGLIQTYNAPITGYGSWWYVFDMQWLPDQGRYNFLLKNTITYSSPYLT